MEELTERRVRMTVPVECMPEFRDFASKESSGLRIESTQERAVQAFGGLGLSNVADVVSIVQGAVLVGQFAVFLHHLIKSRRLKRVVLQTATSQVTLSYSSELSQEAVVEKLRTLLEPPVNG